MICNSSWPDVNTI